MLELLVCNVGDGDAVLVRQRRENAPDYVMLVDCGRPCLECVPGSKRQEAIYHLKREGVDHIDLMLLTHLHIDHIGGALNILRHYPVKKLVALYLPPKDRKWITPPDSDVKAVVGLCHMLNLFADVTDEVVRCGGVCEAATAGEVQLTRALSLTTYLPDKDLAARQKALFDTLYAGGAPDPDEWYRVSKERNCGSLIQLLTYGGRRFLLTGDAYASCWENLPIPACDVVKLPHHGDEKSMTEPLITRLSPAYAVVSCQNDTSAKKDRPNARVIAFVQAHVPHVVCTENKELPTLKKSAHPFVRFTVTGDGTLTCQTDPTPQSCGETYKK